MLEFLEDGHQYRWKGVSVPGVTSLLDGLHSFAGVPMEILEAARERGSRVHDVCQFYDERDLDEEALECEFPEEWGYLQGWKLFLAAAQPTWTHIEEPVFHQVLRYAGKPDRRGSLTVNGVHHQMAVVEIKTPELAHPCWGVQLAAYAAASGSPGVPRFSVQLGRDGTYKIRQWTDANDWPVFASLSTLHTWRTRHGL